MDKHQLFQSISLLVSIFALVFVAVQSWLTRLTIEQQKKTLTVQSLFLVWNSHIQAAHFPIINADDLAAEKINKMTPYHNLPLADARACHFADAVLDTYECINLLGQLGFIEPEIQRVWSESVKYEFNNKNMRNHWMQYHSNAKLSSDNESVAQIYHSDFRNMVDALIKGQLTK